MGKHGDRNLFLVTLAFGLCLFVFIRFIRPYITKPEVVVINTSEAAPYITKPLERDYTVITCNNNIVLTTTHLYNSDRVLISAMAKNVTCDSVLNQFFIGTKLATKQDIIACYLKSIIYI